MKAKIKKLLAIKMGLLGTAGVFCLGAAKFSGAIMAAGCSTAIFSGCAEDEVAKFSSGSRCIISEDDETLGQQVAERPLLISAQLRKLINIFTPFWLA